MFDLVLDRAGGLLAVAGLVTAGLAGWRNWTSPGDAALLAWVALVVGGLSTVNAKLDALLQEHARQRASMARYARAMRLEAEAEVARGSAEGDE